MVTQSPTSAPASPVPGWFVLGLLVLPWVHPWAPGPQSNTVPLLVSWGALATLLVLRRLPSVPELAQAWAIAAVIGSAMGLLQYFGEAAHLGGWVHVPAYLGDAVGNLRQRNQLATLTSLGAVAVLWWQGQGLWRPHAVWMLALLAAGNAATGSRTGLLQWLLLPALVAVWQMVSPARRPVWSWPLLLWAMGVYLLASVALPHALALWSGADVNSALERMGDMAGCGSRGVLWSNVLHLIGHKPWTGWGWGELKYAHYMASYPGIRFCDILGHAHNLPLQLAFAFGIPAALLISGGLIALVLRAQPWRLKRASDSLAWGVLAMVGLHRLLEYPLWYGPFQLATLAAVLMRWTQACQWLAARRSTLQLLGAVVLALVLLIGADYQRMRQIYLPHAQRWSVWREDPWTAARQTLFFSQAVRFAEVTTTPVTPANAAAMLRASEKALHYSPEPRVIERLIESARLSGRADLADWHTQQKSAVYGADGR